MPLQLVLVRHGVTDWNEQGKLLGRSDVPLNVRGEKQAKAVGDALRELRPSAVLSSPQRRTMQTAEAIGEACGVQVKADDRLAEVWLRAWQGKTFDELGSDPDVLKYLADPFHESDEIEPITDVYDRLSGLLEELRDSGLNTPVVLVSHGDPLRILLAEMLGLPRGSFRSFSVDNGYASVARLGRKKTHVQTLNCPPEGLAAIL